MVARWSHFAPPLYALNFRERGELSPPAGTEGDHFVGVNEMVENPVFRHFARYFSAVDNL